MPLTWEEIEARFLCGARFAFDDSEIREAFHFVEETLGREWIERRASPIPGQASIPGDGCIDVVSIYREILSVRGAPGLDKVLAKIGNDDLSARSELSAAHLCVRGTEDIEIQFGVPVTIGEKQRVPDFRLRRADEPWTWVEVTRPRESMAQAEAEAINDRLSGLFTDAPRGRRSEIIIQRRPDQHEIAEIENRFRASAGWTVPNQEHIGDFAILIAVSFEHAAHTPSAVEDEGVQRLCRFIVEGGNDHERRELMIRQAFTDERIEDLLKKEAEQLPPGGPGIVMFATWTAWDQRPAWLPAIQRRFQPNQHTRVSAAILFLAGRGAVGAGIGPVHAARVVPNIRADRAAPDWLLERFTALIPAHAEERASRE
jgi:hypothetical protein